MRSEKTTAAINDYEMKISAWHAADIGPHSQVTVDECRREADAAQLAMEASITEDALHTAELAYRSARVGSIEADLTQARADLVAFLQRGK